MLRKGPLLCTGVLADPLQPIRREIQRVLLLLGILFYAVSVLPGERYVKHRIINNTLEYALNLANVYNTFLSAIQPGILPLLSIRCLMKKYTRAVKQE
jgi:hypothetical protein